MPTILLTACEGRLVTDKGIIRNDAHGIPVMEKDGAVTYLDEMEADVLNALIIAWRTEHPQEFNNILN